MAQRSLYVSWWRRNAVARHVCSLRRNVYSRYALRPWNIRWVTDFIFLGSKITADGDCSHDLKRCLLLGRKVMTKLDSILKSWNITLLTKVHIVKAMVFPVVTYSCESWIVKKAEHPKIDAFEQWYWRRLLPFGALLVIFFFETGLLRATGTIQRMYDALTYLCR